MAAKNGDPTVRELRGQAKGLGIKNASRMPKAELQSAIVRGLANKGGIGSNGGVVMNEEEREFLQAVTNSITSRSELISQLIDPHRNINEEAGYPPDVTSEDYRTMYDRESIATRSVNLLPDETWMIHPSIFETEEPEEVTEFEEAWDRLNESLLGTSWHTCEEDSPIWAWLHRIDQLSGVGAFGVLLLGIDDGKELKEPIEGFVSVDGEGREVVTPQLLSGVDSRYNLIYLRAFDESLIQIQSYETDLTNPRFGQPLKYRLTFNDYRESTVGKAAAGIPLSDQEVHWSRVIHVADNVRSSEVWGVPRMRPFFNRLFDLRKVYAASAEGYWKGAFPGLSIETHPQLGGEVDVDLAAFRTAIEKYQTGLQRYLQLTGMTAKSLVPQTVDPTPWIERAIEAICIQLGCPKRIFMGSERGELASSQDDRTWNRRLMKRQNRYVTPKIVVPFIDRLISIGILPPPAEENGYTVRWEDMNALSDEQRAAIAVQRTDAMTKFVAGNVVSLITEMDFLTKVLGFGDEEAMQMLNAAKENMDLGDTPLTEEPSDAEETGSEEFPGGSTGSDEQGDESQAGDSGQQGGDG